MTEFAVDNIRDYLGGGQGGVEGIAADLSGTGFYTLVLPFLLVFAIVFGILENLGLFGQDSTKPNVIISAVIAIFATVFFEMGPILGLLQGPWALWLILLLMVMITLQLVGVDVTGGEVFGQSISAILGVVALLGVLYLYVVPGRGQPLEAVFGTEVGTGLTAIPIIGPIIADVGIATIMLIAIAIGAVVWMFKD